MQPSIKTERLIIRSFDLSDASRVQLLAGDPRVSEMTENIPYPYNDGMAEAWIESLGPAWEGRKSATFAICIEPAGLLVGCCGLELSTVNKRASLGYWVGVDHWNRGICSEAATAIVQFGFENLSLHRIQATHLSRNPASGAVMRKIGMSHEATMKDYVFKNGRFEDMELYAVLFECAESAQVKQV